MPKFRRVTGLFRAATPDGPDADYTPELEALNGQIEFIPRYRDGVIAYPRLDPPEFVRPEPIQAVLQDGQVMTQVTVEEETVVQPVELLVSDDDEATQSWQWEAVFRDIRVGRWGDEVSISPLRFTVPDEHGPLDLTEVVGEKSGGTITVKGPRGEGLADIIVDGTTLTMVWDGGRTRTVTVPTVRGIGVPDGGSPGQVVTRTATGAEWAAAVPDTRPRDFPDRVQGWSDVGRARVRRIGPNVAFYLQLRRPMEEFYQGVQWFDMMDLPEGFRPESTVLMPLTAPAEAEPIAVIYIIPSGRVLAYRARVSGNWGFVNFAYFTSDPWPA